FAPATVTRVIEDNTAGDYVNSGDQTVKVKITGGKFEGMTATATNMNGYLYGTYCKKGTHVIIQVSEYNGSLSASVYSFDRRPGMYIIALSLAAALIFVGRKKGVSSTLALIFTFVTIIFLYLPLLYIGVSPFLAAVIAVIIITLVSVYLICGLNDKGFCAAAGTVTGVIIAGIFAWIFGKLLRIDGYNVSDIENLIYVAGNSRLDIGGLFFSGILIASLGAVMDVAVSISASLLEIKEKNPSITSKELFKSGMNIGKDMTGTMSNTLILAFAGSSINTMVLIYAYSMPYLQVVDMTEIGIEVIRGFAGTLGIVLSVPLVSFYCSRVYAGSPEETEAVEETPQEKINENTSLN
ncbi:MAG: YibE/F family protein, partial [Candidatus Weimeria sp.]